jgi:hypothetical protein
MDAMAWAVSLIVLMLAFWLTSTILKMGRERRLLADVIAGIGIILLGVLSFGILSIAGVNSVNPVRFILVFLSVIAAFRVARVFSGSGLSR